MPAPTFGLVPCGGCGRRKAVQGQARCADCESISRLVGSPHGPELAEMYRLWGYGRKIPPPSASFAAHADFKLFATLEELMNAYDGWLG